MKTLLVFIIPLLFSVSSQASDTDTTDLQGTWRAIQATSNGEPPAKELLEKLTLVFVKDTVSIMGAPPTRFRLDPSAKPSHIDFLNSAHQSGIYLIEGDTLKLCTGQNGDRPKVFETKKFTDHTYMLLKRVKE